MEVTLLRCEFNKQLDVGDVATCVHAKLGQLLLYWLNLALRMAANALAV